MKRQHRFLAVCVSAIGFWLLSASRIYSPITATHVGYDSTVIGRVGVHTSVARGLLFDSLLLEPVHVMTALCAHGYIDHVLPGLTVLRSILVARENGPTPTRPYILHIVADEFIAGIIYEIRNTSAPRLNPHRNLFDNM
jgi:hypothetical protein